MLGSNLDLSDSVLDILHTPLRSARCLAEDIVERWKNKGRRSRQNSKQQDNTSMTVTVLVPGIRLFGLFNFGNYCSNSSIKFCD